MPRRQQCEDGIPILSEDRQAANAQPDCRVRLEQLMFEEQLNREYAVEVDERIAKIAQPRRCRRRSPTDVDHDWQYDPVKATALPILTALDGVRRARSGLCVAVRGENYRCLRCMRPINGRPTLPNGFVMAATRTRSSKAGPKHKAHEKS